MFINGLEVGMFRDLQPEAKVRLQQLAMLLCPQVFGIASNKFDRVNLVFLEFGPVLSSNIRDLFSAGGKASYVLPSGEDLEVRSIDNRLILWASVLEDHLARLPESTLERYWGERLKTTGAERLEQFLKLIDHHSQNAPISINLSTLFLDSIGHQNRSSGSNSSEHTRIGGN